MQPVKQSTKSLIEIGQSFHRMTVIGTPAIGSNRSVKYTCKCECGRVKLVLGRYLTAGLTKSCGCLRSDRMRSIGKEGRIKHGDTRGGKTTSEYFTWASMIQRCRRVGHRFFVNYGGRGISVCERWEGSFVNFLADMGRKPTRQHSIDRIDVNGNYEPGNCRWATRKEQSANKRPRVKREEEDVFAVAGSMASVDLPPFPIDFDEVPF